MHREARPFPAACIASPHYLATIAGLEVLASGGNAVDAAIATNLTLGVVAPYLCGYGGDLFAMVWDGGSVTGYAGAGRAPRAASVETVREAAGSDRMPERGPLAITVPGAVEGWFALLDRFGTRPFAELATRARGYASSGFTLTHRAAAAIQRSRGVFAQAGWATMWDRTYGAVAGGDLLAQPDLARTIDLLGEHGVDAYYRGPIGEAIASCVRSHGGMLDPEDLAAHSGEWVEPLHGRYRDIEVLEMPPPTQGVTALEALAIVEASGALPPEGVDRQHLLLEAAKLALADREAFVTEPAEMPVPPSRLLSRAWVRDRAGSIRSNAAAEGPSVAPMSGDTAYLCTADANGMLVSLIQSNYMGFGCGVRVPEWGINLHNRGASFSLDPTRTNAIGPRKRTMHTIIPGMALRDGRPWLVFGSMGGDGQPQTHLQMLSRVVDDREDLQRAVDAARWFVSPADWSVTAESRFDRQTLEGLRRRGHRIEVTERFDSLMGHAHAIEVTDHGYRGATDPRAEGAVLGL